MPEPFLINTFSRHYRAKYGHPVGKIPIDLGVVCPNRAQGGCIFCRPAGFAPGYLDSADAPATQIARGKAGLLKSRFNCYFAYFQQETSTAMPAEQLLACLRDILEDEACLGAILSTRPDHIPDELLSGLTDLVDGTDKECIFELGLQSVHEHSLQLLNRNHTFVDAVDALRRIRAAGPFTVGMHLIFGIPGESEEDMLHSLTTVCELGIDALKLHHLQVLKDTELHRRFLRGEVKPFSLDGYLEFLLRALPLIPARVIIHRLWASCHPELLVAPRWNILATHLSQTLQQQMLARDILQGENVTRDST